MRYRPTDGPETAAFNYGSDARILGIPLRRNPYPPESCEWDAWRRGWQDVDRCWQADVPIDQRRRLPDVA